MGSYLASISALIAAHIIFVSPAQVSFADDSPTSQRCAVYAKIILPRKAPAEGKHSPVESWVARKLHRRGNTDLRAVTPWVRIAANAEEAADVWDATLDGKLCGCPVVGHVSKPMADGKVKVHLNGWSPVGAEVKGNTLLAEAGSRRICVVDTGRVDGVKYYVAIFVGPTSPDER
jgi:hypothetical protein